MSNIAIVCGAGVFFGKETIALELGEGLRESGQNVTFVSSLWGDGCFRERVKALEFPIYLMRLGFISATLRFDCLRMTADQLRRWPGLLADYRRVLREVKPEKIIHTNWQHLLLLWPLLNPRRDVFWLHESIPNKPQYRRVFGWLSRRLRFFVPVSHAVARSLDDIGIPQHKIRVIHNGYSDPVPSMARPTRQATGLHVGIAGQMGPYKGHEDLVDAFGEIAFKHPGAELHVFGRGQSEFEDRLKRKVHELNITSRVFWRGYVPERSTIYLDSDIFVVPSRGSDPLPGVAVEAAFFGLPVVASNCGGLPEIVQDGTTGFLVEAQNPAALANRLDQLLQDTDLRSKMGKAARQRAENHFARERFVADFLHLLNESQAEEKRLERC